MHNHHVNFISQIWLQRAQSSIKNWLSEFKSFLAFLRYFKIVLYCSYQLLMNNISCCNYNYILPHIIISMVLQNHILTDRLHIWNIS